MKDFPAYGKGNTGRLMRSKESLPAVASFKFLAILGLVLVLALFFVAQRIEFIRTERRIKHLLIERRKITEEILPIKLEVYNLSRLNKVEEMGKQTFNLHRPYASQVIRYVPPAPEPTEEEVTTEAQTGVPASGEPEAPAQAGPDIQAPEQ